MGAELSNGKTERHDEFNSRSLNFPNASENIAVLQGHYFSTITN